MLKRSFGTLVLTLIAFPIGLFAQAALEYGLRSGTSLFTQPKTYAVAGCNVDSTVLGCLSHYYPRTALVVAGAICLLIVRWLAGITSHKTR